MRKRELQTHLLWEIQGGKPYSITLDSLAEYKRLNGKAQMKVTEKMKFRTNTRKYFSLKQKYNFSIAYWAKFGIGVTGVIKERRYYSGGTVLTKMTCNGLNGLFLFHKFMFFLKNFDYKSSCCDLDSMNLKRMYQILSIKMLGFLSSLNSCKPVIENHQSRDRSIRSSNLR